MRATRLSPSGVVTMSVVGAACIFVLAQLEPSLLLRDTTPAGGDMGAHVWGPDYLRDHVLPEGRITGWAPDWYAGFAFPSFYFPLPSLLIVAGDLLVPYNVAFKLVSALGMITLPAAAYAFGRLAGLRRPGPALLAVAAVPFLFERSFTIYGGNIPSTLAGEFSFSISLSLALVFLGVLARGLDTARHKALAAGLLALTLLCHVIPTFFAVAGAVVITLLRPSRRRLGHTVTVGVVAGLLVAFWALPFVANLGLTNDMGYERITTYLQNLFPGWAEPDPNQARLGDADLRWLVVLAAAGGVVSVARNCRVGMFLTIMAGLAAFGFRFAPQGKIWNARLLPFWFLCLYLLAGVAVAWALRGLAGLAARRSRLAGDLVAGVVGPPVVLGAVLAVVALPLGSLPSWAPLKTKDASFIPGWVRWNYSGFEDVAKRRRGEYFELMSTMREVGRSNGCGRALWEYESELNDMGTPLALMLLPYWTDSCIASMEGLYFESSATTPFHFLTAAEVTKRPSNPQRGLPYRGLDLTNGVRHLQLLGVRYYMAISPDAQSAARAQPDLHLVASAGPFSVHYPEGQQQRTWEIYEVGGSALVEPLTHEPVVMSGMGHGEKEWLAAAVPWFQDTARWEVPLAVDGPREWRRVSGAVADPPRTPVRPASVSRVRTGSHRITFEVDRPGTPVLVKASYFPNWVASGARGPWRVTPNAMVVVPTGRHVELRYGYTRVDMAGATLTGLGLLSLVVLARRREPPPGENGDENSAAVVAGEGEVEEGEDAGVDVLVGAGVGSSALAPESEAQAHEAADRATAPAQDRRSRRARLAHRDRDLGHPQAGPLGTKDELGVEQVGPEPAVLDEP